MTDLFGELKFTVYQAENLAEVLAFVGECNRKPGFDNFHPGDIAHWMSNIFHGRNASEHFGLFRDENNKIVALNIVSPVAFSAFDLIVRPDYRGSSLERALLKISEKTLLDRLEAANITDKKLTTTLCSDDSNRKLFLEEMGYHRNAAQLDIFNARSLNEPIPEPNLPPGFSIRSAAGEHEAANLAAVHNSAFRPKWTESSYLEVMRSPAYAVERELVVVAPDGTFAAFLVYWPDPISRSGLFEPVGCHKDFQRKGLTKALMYSAMQRMKATGLETALVLYNADNPASKALYTSVGFRPVHEVYEYQSTL